MAEVWLTRNMGIGKIGATRYSSGSYRKLEDATHFLRSLVKRLFFDPGARKRDQAQASSFLGLKPFEYLLGFGCRTTFVGPAINDADQ